MRNLQEQDQSQFGMNQKDTRNQAMVFPLKDFGQTYPDSFATQQTLKIMTAAGLVQRQYLVDGFWFKGKPPGKPEDTQIIFDNLSTFQRFEDAVSIWNSIAAMSAYSPKRPELTLARLVEKLLTRETLLLFTPWGSITGKTSTGRQEKEAMESLRNIQILLNQSNIKSQFLIMPADVYAIEINRRPKDETLQYFENVTRLAESFGFSVLPWSLIRRKNSQIYKFYQDKLTDIALNRLLSKKIIWQAIEQAKRWSGFTDSKEIQQAAYAYMRERLIEDSIIDTLYAPIKISAVTPAKDVLDVTLPVLYIFNQETQYPWIPFSMRQKTKNDNDNIRR